MYNSNKAKEIETLAKDSEATTNSIGAGIYENVRLIGAKSDISKNGNKFIELSFDVNGTTVRSTEYEPRKEYFGTPVDPAALQTKQANQYARMVKILKCFYTDEEINCDCDTFEEFANWIVSMLTGKDDVLLRVKFVYNDAGYLTLPSYIKFTWIELMSVEVSKMEILGIDRMTKVKADTEVKTPVDPLAMPQNPVTSDPWIQQTTYTAQATTSSLPF